MPARSAEHAEEKTVTSECEAGVAAMAIGKQQQQEEKSTKMVILQTSDGHSFEVPEEVALQSQFIRNMAEDMSIEKVDIPSNVLGPTLSRVIEYCSYHVMQAKHDKRASAGTSAHDIEDQIKQWDTTFVRSLDLESHQHLINAANFLDIKGLMDLTCQALADIIKTKKVEEVRDMFGIVNDFTPEEEEEVRRENQWANDD